MDRQIGRQTARQKGTIIFLYKYGKERAMTKAMDKIQDERNEMDRDRLAIVQEGEEVGSREGKGEVEGGWGWGWSPPSVPSIVARGIASSTE